MEEKPEKETTVHLDYEVEVKRRHVFGNMILEATNVMNEGRCHLSTSHPFKTQLPLIRTEHLNK